MRASVTIASLASLMVLGACGGTGITGPTSANLAPATKTVGTGTALDGTVPSHIADGVLVPININGVQIAGVLKDGNLKSGTFGGAQNSLTAAGLTFDVVAFSDDGKASAGQQARVEATVIGTAASSSTGTFQQVARYGRVTDTLLPVSGGATYTGGYRATYGSVSAGISGSGIGGLIAIKGNASLTADFNNDTISGAITGRTSLLSDGTSPDTFADVNLAATGITGTGTFAGSASGGKNASQGGIGDGTGNYEGMFGGTSGSAMAGALWMNYLLGGDTYTEVGVFTATRP